METCEKCKDDTERNRLIESVRTSEKLSDIALSHSRIEQLYEISKACPSLVLGE